MCQHATSGDYRPPQRAARIYKEECTFCFDGQDDAQGVDICLSCYVSSCPREHSEMHARKFSHPLAMNYKRSLKTARSDQDPPKKISKLSIAAENEAEKYQHASKIVCVLCNREDVAITDNLQQVVDGIVAATSASKQNEIQAWELEIQPCEHTLCLEQQQSRHLQADLAHCGDCELKENLWLCLTCGNLGCGRQQFGGVSGNGHGLKHFESTEHPVSVKLGTITPEGNADVYCYQCNEERQDTNLAAHLAHWGINIATQEKTEKSLVEMQIEQNLKFEFNMTTADGTKLAPVYGAGLTGLKNLGNSCYLSSVLQSLFRLPAFQARYWQDAQKHVQECRSTTPDMCWECQWHKLGDGLWSGRYSKPGQFGEEQDGIAPGMFKALVGKGHAEFSTMKQQDATEFLQHVLKLVQQNERKSKNDPSHVFGYKTRGRLQCNSCHRVQYSTVDNHGPMNLLIPADKLKEALAAEKGDADDKKASVSVNIRDCFDYVFAEEVIDFDCPQCNKKVQATKSSGFETYPQVLALAVQRFTYDNWVPKKTGILVRIEDGNKTLDLSKWKIKAPAANEELLPDTSSASSAGAAPEVDQAAMEQLMAMGFPPVRCQRALITTGNQGAEVAMSWLFEHMDDPDIDQPIQPATKGAAAPDEGSISMLMDMGFSRPQALKALKETSGNMERAVEYLFSHADTMEVDSAEQSGGAPEEASTRSDSADHATYTLNSFINHKGPSMHCGHYVCHIRDQQRWILINDNRVVEQPDPSRMQEEAYVLLFKRNQ
ncbi:ubiquitin C-terminal hydrolase Ubp14 [Sorochytrium milnesiophthora]